MQPAEYEAGHRHACCRCNACWQAGRCIRQAAAQCLLHEGSEQGLLAHACPQRQQPQALRCGGKCEGEDDVWGSWAAGGQRWMRSWMDRRLGVVDG